MAIDRFTKQQFEAALPSNFISGGLVNGEYTYIVPVTDFSRIQVRSSVDASGRAADTGEDSIRLWLQIRRADQTWRPFTKKTDAYTTRVSGWDVRMGQKIAELAARAALIRRPVSACPDCGEIKVAWVTGKGKNKGRPACKCIACDSGFEWLDEPMSDVTPNVTGARSWSSAQNAEASLSQPSSTTDDDGSTTVQTDSVADILSGNTTAKKRSVENPGLFSSIQIPTTAPTPQAVQGAEPSPGLAIRLKANDQQRAAILAPTDKAVRVLAGPGAGKTTVLKQRYAYLIDQGVEPRQIIAVTFNKTMADELLKAIVEFEPSIADDRAAQRGICTIHALCFRIMMNEGMTRQVAKTWQVKSFLTTLVDENWAGCEVKPAWHEVFSAITHAKSRCLQPGQDVDFYIEAFGEFHGIRLAKTRARYEVLMVGENLLTFSDMLYEVELLLTTNESARTRLQNLYTYILADEFQDTSGQAMRILTTLAQPQNLLFAVGDPDQLLYRFAGATPEENLYDGFDHRYATATTHKLETNYRSTGAIVAACNSLIAHNYVNGGGPYAEDFRKTLRPRPNADNGQQITFAEFDDAEDEADAIAYDIRASLDDGTLAPGDIFIGVRTRAQLAYLEGPLTRLQIPYINAGGGSFWAMKHVQDVISYVRLAYDNGHKESFGRIYNIATKHNTDRNGNYLPHRYLGNAFLGMCGGSYLNIRTALRNTKRFRGAQDLIDFMADIESVLQDEGLSHALQFVVEECYRDWINFEEDVEEGDSNKLDDLASVVNVAQGFTDPGEFFTFVDDSVEKAKAAANKNWDGYVVIATIHRLKGLERECVYGPGWSEGNLPLPNGVSMPYGILPHSYALTAGKSSGVLGFTRYSKFEDERCIAFVLASRAKTQLHLSSIRSHRGADLAPSRFIYEMGIQPDTQPEVGATVVALYDELDTDATQRLLDHDWSE